MSYHTRSRSRSPPQNPFDRHFNNPNDNLFENENTQLDVEPWSWNNQNDSELLPSSFVDEPDQNMFSNNEHEEFFMPELHEENNNKKEEVLALLIRKHQPLMEISTEERTQQLNRRHRKKRVSSAKRAKLMAPVPKQPRKEVDFPTLPQVTPVHQFETSPDDWFEQKKIDVRAERNGQLRVIALEYLPFEYGTIQWAGKFVHPLPHAISDLTREQAATVVTDVNQVQYDLKYSWIGKLNHAPHTAPEQNVSTYLDGVIQSRPIARGEELRWDYGMDYWVFQVTGIDREQWSEIHVGLFREMHDRVVDYDELLQWKLYESKDPEFILKKIQEYLHLFPKKHTFLIYRTTLPAQQHNRWFVKPAIYVKTVDPEEDDGKIVVSTRSIVYSIPRDEKNALPENMNKTGKYSVRFVILHNTSTKETLTYAHGVDLVAYFVRKSNVSRELGKFASPLEKLKVDVPNSHNNGIGKEVNTLTAAGAERLLTNTKIQPHYREFIKNQILPHLSN